MKNRISQLLFLREVTHILSYRTSPPQGGGPRTQIVPNPKKCSQVIFYIPKHPRTLSKRFGMFFGRQGTFKSHFQDFFENYDFLCIFPLHHHTGITQELHRNLVQTDKNTFLEQILIPTSPKSSLQYQKTFLLPRTTLRKSKTMIGTI